MLKVLRDNLKYLSWVLWAVIAVFILFVFVDFGGTVPGATVATDAAATVGDATISYGEFEQSYRRAEDFYRQAYGDQFSPDLGRQMGLPMQVLNSLVNEKILYQEAERVGLQITDKELQKTILEQPVFLGEDGRFVGEESYQEILRSNGLTPETFEADLRNQLLTDKLRRVLLQGVFLSDSEVEQAYRDQVEQAKIRYLNLPAERFSDLVEVSEPELEAYFTDNSEDFRLPERRKVRYLAINSDELGNAIEITEEEARTYYDNNQGEFEQDEQVQARHILLKASDDITEEEVRAQLDVVRTRVGAGEDFGDIARVLSEDPGSKPSGGDLGFFGRGQMVKEFEDAAFGGAPGDLVGPVKSAFGFHLIEILDRRQGGKRPLEEVRDEITSRLARERAEEAAEAKASELTARLRNQTETSAGMLAEIATEEVGVREETTEAFGRDETIEGIGRSTPFAVAAFDLETGAASDPVRIAEGWAVLVLDESLEPRTPTLEEVGAEVEEALRDKKRQALALAELGSARDRIAAGATFEDLSASLDLEVQETPEFGRGGFIGGLGDIPAVRNAAFELNEGELGGPIAIDEGALLFELVERKRFDPAAFAEEEAATRDQATNERLNQLIASIVEARREELAVTYDPKLLATFAPSAEG